MNNYNGIDKYLNMVSLLDDYEYQKLMDNYGTMRVKEYFKLIANDSDKFKLISGKIKLDTINYDKVIENVLLIRSSKIKRDIDELIRQRGINTNKISLVSDKVVFVMDKINNSSKLCEINMLYQEFLSIRNKIWNYYLYLLNDLLDKYKDDTKYNDLYQEASIAMIRAIENYKPRVFYFKGYLASYIRYNINYYYHDLDLCLKLPVNKRHQYYKTYKVIENYVDTYHKMPTKEELVRLLGITKRIMAIFLSLSLESVNYLSDTLDIDNEYMKMEEVVSDNKNIRQVEDYVIGGNLHDDLFLELAKLDDREKTLIMDYYFNNITLEQIAKELGVSYGTTFNIKKRALDKLGRNKEDFKKYLR